MSNFILEKGETCAIAHLKQLELRVIYFSVLYAGFSKILAHY